MATITIDRIEINEKNWLVGYYSHGGNTVLGRVTTEAGAKAMLTRRAKQFGLVKSKDGKSAAR